MPVASSFESDLFGEGQCAVRGIFSEVGEVETFGFQVGEKLLDVVFVTASHT